MSIQILQGDCREVLKTLADASIDSIVTDPPYHLTTGKKGGSGPASVNLNTPQERARVTTGFMGMAWDGGDVAQDPAMWAECLRVLKPGGHLLAFSGTRTQHRMVCAIEDAGFEIRDQAGWMYGSGFPKSLDVSKAIDKAAGATREVLTEGKAVKRMIPGADQNDTGSWIKDNGREFVPAVTAAATAEAQQWQGWGTALKPAWEPICIARKPLAKGATVASNMLAYGTGALNIDGCRIEVTDSAYARNASGDRGHADNRERSMDFGMTAGSAHALGRWPANLLHDGSPEVVALFPSEAGAAAPVTTRNGDKFRGTYGAFAGNVDEAGSTFHADSGSAARFFWCPKTSSTDRHAGLHHPGQQFTNGATLRAAENLEEKGNYHPTVKPTELMRYLCRLVTPPGGIVLDPFMGSGSTLKAAELEGFSAIGIELDPAYIAIAKRRIAADMPLFAEVAA
jgi:site-specific DNA-methyltransferase (adenine-specific)